MEQLGGIAAADERLGRRFPLPGAVLPLTRWVEVRALGDGDGTEVEWNLDDSRPGSPGRLALYVGHAPPPDQLPEEGGEATRVELAGRHMTVRRSPLEHAQASLRPALELRWRTASLQLRLTAQGPWAMEDVLAIAASVDLDH
ncbi:hypothetical protein [Paraconexibacter sp.]|uniref:hypothetical protein n=1 Tax=Paraconexibacter sp. TaxID=2949640 RepID=UPI003561DB8C